MNLRPRNEPFLVVGDGTHTFGDYNGVDAIWAALRDANARNTPSMTIIVKAGSYNVTDTTPLSPTADLRLIAEPGQIEGTAPQIANAHTSDIATITSTHNVTVEGIEFTNNGATAPRAIQAPTIVARDCKFAAGVEIHAPGIASKFERCLFENPNGPCLLLTSGSAATSRCTLDGCDLSAALGSYPLIQYNPGTYGFMAVRGSSLITGTNAGGSPTPNTGVFCFNDGSGGNHVNVQSIAFDDCAMQTATGAVGSFILRQRVGIASSDDATATLSTLKQLCFRRCQMQQLATHNGSVGLGLFRFEDVPNASTATDQMTHLVIDQCEFDLFFQQSGVDSVEVTATTNDAAAIFLRPAYLSWRDSYIRHMPISLYPSGAPSRTNFQAALFVSPNAPSPTFATPTPGAMMDALVDGFYLDDYLGGVTGTKQSAIIAVQAITGARVTIRRAVIECVDLGSAIASAAVVYGYGDGQMLVADSEFSTTGMSANVSGVGLRHMIVDDCQFTDSGTTTNHVNWSSVPSSGDPPVCRVSNCDVVQGAIGINVSASTSTAFAEVRGNKITGCSGLGISMDVRDSSVVNNRAWGNNGGVTAVQIKFGTHCVNAQCFGNNCVDSASSSLGLIETDFSVGGTTTNGFDTIDVNTLGNHTNAQGMRFNTATLQNP